VEITPVNLLNQQLALQRQLESLQQEGRNQMVSLQKSLGDADSSQRSQQMQQSQQIPSALQQQLEFLQKKEQENQQQLALKKQDLQRSGSGASAQNAMGGVRNDPPSLKTSEQQPAPILPIKLFGVGIFFATDASGGQVVRSFVPGGPAERSGQVSIGDVIVSVDSTDVYGLPLATLAKYLLGPRGSTISMGFCKPHDKTVRCVSPCALVTCALMF
jgi:C-terminal processing protease CtpA/Prc